MSKRTSLDAVLGKITPAQSEPTPAPKAQTKGNVSTLNAGKRPGVKQQTAYLPTPVYEQLRRLAFEERAKMHAYLMEGLDLVFQKRGLPSIAELTSK